jgi:hypothetical protein
MERAGHYIRTYTGRQYWPMDPRAEDICIEDVAHALSNLCRFTGHTAKFYSVAEHSVYVSFLVHESLAFAGLLHDAHEAYINDIAKPLKLCLPEYGAVEAKNWAVLAEAFGLPVDLDPRIKEADSAAFRAERIQLMTAWQGPLVTADTVGEGWTPVAPKLGMLPEQAKAAFLERFYELDPR